MHISFSELRSIKHALPTGSINKIANQLEMSEQSVRNYFGANKYKDGEIIQKHVQPGPNGGFVQLQDTRVLDLAKKILNQNQLVDAN